MDESPSGSGLGALLVLGRRATVRRLVRRRAFRSALEAGATRLRPVIMTATAMIIGMVPMALGLGEGGEQNAPLGRAVIGGLLFATVATLFFVPTVFAIVRSRGTGHNAITEEPHVA